MKFAAHRATSGAWHAADLSGNKNYMDFVQEGSDKEHSDKTFATFVEAFSGHEEVPVLHGAAVNPEPADLENFLRLQPGRGLEDAKASCPLAASTVSVATEDDASSGTTENSSVPGEGEFAKSTSPRPPKRLRAAHKRLDDRGDIKVIQKWLGFDRAREQLLRDRGGRFCEGRFVLSSTCAVGCSCKVGISSDGLQ